MSQNYQLAMSTRKYMPENVMLHGGWESKSRKRDLDALARHIKRSVREPRNAVIDIELMTDQFDVYLNGTKIAVYMAGG